MVNEIQVCLIKFKNFFMCSKAPKW